MNNHIYAYVDDQKFKVLNFFTESCQEIDVYGNSKGRTDIGVYTIKVPFDANPILHQWAMSDHDIKNVKLVVSSRNTIGKSTIYELHNCFVSG